MMNRSPDILFMAEYIKNVLFFATVRQGKVLKNTPETHYFCIDDELVYENYYSDFGPLNLGCVYKYCRILNEKLKLYLNKQIIVHYTSIDPKKKANSAFLLGCYGVLYLSLSPRDALKPLMVHGQSYRSKMLLFKPFQDATQGESNYTISLMDCLQAIKKARELGFFNFQDFNYEEYDRLDKIQGGDLNWIVPGKFLAFIGPVDYSVSLYHPPEMYIDYFMENNVKIVIRLNKRLYDGNVFTNVGIIHYDLFFVDGSCPPRHILFKFLQISEEASCAIAVHCKAGLGRTGSLIGCYLIKHYRMTSHEAIGWMRICRPGSVIGQQQGWLEQLEPWLIKQGNLYRKRTHQDTEKMPLHEFGVYSIAEKTMKQRPIVFQKCPSPPPPLQKHTRPDLTVPVRPQNSRIKEDGGNRQNCDDDEVFITSCDLTVLPTAAMTQMKGCIIKNTLISEECETSDRSENISTWKKYLCCHHECIENINEGLWKLSVRCASCAPDKANKLCALSKAAEKECEWRMKVQMNNSQKILYRGDHHFDAINNVSRRSSGAGEPRSGRPSSRTSSTRSPMSNENVKSHARDSESKSLRSYPPITTYRTSQAPVIKSVNDARNYLLRSSIYNTERVKQLNSSMIVTPPYKSRPQISQPNSSPYAPVGGAHITPSSYSTVSKIPVQSQHRRRLGRSPSPAGRMVNEQSRATNTPSPSPTEKFLVKDASKSALKDVLSRLKLSMCRDGSLGAASLGATRDAPAPRAAPSVRSDERPLATQGDMLNSIKFQRRLRDTLNVGKSGAFMQNVSMAQKKPSVKNINSRLASNNNTPKPSLLPQDFNYSSAPREKSGSMSRSFYSPPRPMSPKGRRNSQTTSFY